MARRLAVAGVIRRGEADPPNTRAVAVVVDGGHPKGPIAGKVVWAVDADAAGPPRGPGTFRGHAMNEVFRRIAHHLETGQ